MTYEEAMEGIRALEGRPVELDMLVLRAASMYDEWVPVVESGTDGRADHGGCFGVLRRRHPSEFDEFWWTLPTATWFAVEPGGAFVVAKSRFRGGRWFQDSLVLDLGGYLRRIVPLVRCDALELLAWVRDYDRN